MALDENPSDALLEAALEPLKGSAFHFATFDPRRFHDTHYHCASCWKTIAGPEDSEAEHEGFVTIQEIRYAGLPPSYEYRWLCMECFAALHEKYALDASSGEPPEISESAQRRFLSESRRHYRAHRKSGSGDGVEEAFAHVSWAPSEIVAIARNMGIEISNENAEEFLVLHESHLRDVMTGHAVQLIRQFLAGRGE